MYAIKVKNVSKTYNLYKKNSQKVKAILFNRPHNLTREALKDVSFTIEQGEQVAIFGRRGSGRSTLLRIIAKRRFPTSGKVFTKGTMNTMFGLLGGLDPGMPGRDNVRLKGTYMGWKRDKIDAEEKEILEFAKIEDAKGLALRRLPPGTTGRLGFIMHMKDDKDIVLMDEGFGVGTRASRVECINILEEYVSKPERTFVMVTNNLLLAQRLCKRGIVLEKGELVFDGEIKEAIAEYKKVANEAYLKDTDRDELESSYNMNDDDENDDDEFTM